MTASVPIGDSAAVRRGGAVATASEPATRAALDMLRHGGNAVDAAVAAAFALSVCEPSGSGLGGQACVLRAAPGGSVAAVDGHAHAPAAVSRKLVSRMQQRSGVRACTVPTAVAVLGYVHSRWGALPWPVVLAPAVTLAYDGFALTRLGRRQLRWASAALLQDEATRAAFLPDGLVPDIGYRVVQPVLGATLERLADAGPDDFYTGALARRIVAEMAARDGLVSSDDLAAAGTASWQPPVAARRGSSTVATLSAPSGGPVLLLALHAARVLAAEVGADKAHTTVIRALATRAAHSVRDDRSPERLREQSSFFDAMLEETVDRARADYARYDAAALPMIHSHGRPVEEPGDTTHVSVIDSSGMAVALTSSIQSLFGAKVISPGLGFFWNNYLRTCPRRRAPYRLSSGCRPRSNAAPTIVLDAAGTPVLAVGAAGSRRITSSLVHVLGRVLDDGIPVQKAVRRARIHATTRELWVERPLLAELPPSADPVRRRQRHDYTMGAVQAVQRQADGSVSGAADPRREGVAVVEGELGSLTRVGAA
jgi:gamma-glutamyltranspeptidase/glutathione hydrolase